MDYIADYSGNGRHLKAGGGTTRPLCRTNVQNGLRAWQFDGTNDVVESVVPGATVDTGVFGPLKPPQWTQAMVFICSGAIGTTVLMTANDKDAPGNTSLGAALVGSRFLSSFVIGGIVSSVSAGPTLVAGRAYTGIMRYDGAAVIAEINGTGRNSVPATGMPTYPGLQPFAMGDLPFNRGGTPQIPFNGYMCECVYWGCALSDDELVVEVERLRSIWAHH